MMMIKETKDVRPLLLKFGMALAISFAGFLYARIRHKRVMPSDSPPSTPPSSSESNRSVDYGGRLRIKDDPQADLDFVDSYDKPCIRVHDGSLSMHESPSGRHIGDKDGFLLPEFDQLVHDINTSTTLKPDVKDFMIRNNLPGAIYSVEEDEHEIEGLKRRVTYLMERERKLEVQLLEYYGLKEQETAMTELQNRLKVNTIEAKLFSVKIGSLQAENKRLAAQFVDYSKVVSELESANANIKLLKRKIRHESQQNREHILDLAQRVRNLRDQENEATPSDSDGHPELHRMTDLEKEADELRKSNESLQKENDELARTLESTQFLANFILEEDTEKEGLHKEMLNLREENENLTKEVERLQADRCTDAEELVYLRWINACLRYELRNYKPPPGKTVARDLSKCLSPNSEKKAKQMILEYANTEDGDHKEPSIVDFDYENWPSSYPSYLTDSTEPDDSPHHGSDNKRHHKKLRIFARLRRLIMGKHDHHGRVSPIDRSHLVDHDISKRRSSESPDGTDESLNLASSSQNSNNSSLGFQHLSRLDEQDPKDVEDTTKMSDFRSSPGGVRFVLRSKSTNSSPIDYYPNDGQKSELAKYAEILRDSSSLPKTHKKSASYSPGLR